MRMILVRILITFFNFSNCHCQAGEGIPIASIGSEILPQFTFPDHICRFSMSDPHLWCLFDNTYELCLQVFSFTFITQILNLAPYKIFQFRKS